MRLTPLITFFLFLILIVETKANDPQLGYAIVRKDTVYGKIKINFDSGSIVVKQDSVNRMFFNDINLVRIFNETRETYIPFAHREKTVFYSVLVLGTKPLLMHENVFFTKVDDELVALEDVTDLYSLFGKKNVKEYVFIRALDVESKTGLIDLFAYFNEYNAF